MNYIKVIAAYFLFMGTTLAGNINPDFFSKTNDFFQKHVTNGSVDYAAVKNDSQLEELIASIATADLSEASDATKQAFYINAYNLLVINSAANAYPLSSVQEVSGFFDRKKHLVSGEKMTLTQLENNKLLKTYGDPRYHFVLVCGAVGCPPITNFAYTPDLLEKQLDQQTALAMNDNSFIKIMEGKLAVSEIFKWYTDDFGGSKKSIVKFINEYRGSMLPENAKVYFYDYDWLLNDQSLTGGTGSAGATSNNASRYVVSSTIAKGSTETKIFNNLFSQQTGSRENLTDRSTFNTVLLSFLYGATNRLNVGFSTRYRRVRNDKLPSNLFSVFGNTIDQANGESQRSGITSIGPQIRYAPVKKWSNFSIQSQLLFAVGDDLEGNGVDPFIDWTGATWWTQFFNDFAIGDNFSLFTELDFLIEDLGTGNSNRISTPGTLIFSYNPTSKTTLYTLGSYSPFWQADFDYFTQLGIGAKYQFTPNLELELLVTDFNNKFFNQNGGQANTFNLGLRFNI